MATDIYPKQTNWFNSLFVKVAVGLFSIFAVFVAGIFWNAYTELKDKNDKQEIVLSRHTYELDTLKASSISEEKLRKIIIEAISESKVIVEYRLQQLEKKADQK